ncbi:MAG TPA: hypothetical protein PKM63_21805 [Panacibacter sp.]|nr:hypothetical protein [Panacibacter sp.]HNP46948.1 hypothetical protein [Panacibacter sp.]
MKTTIDELPNDVIAQTLDDVLIDYSIACVLDIQSQPPQEAVENIRKLKRIRDKMRDNDRPAA